MKLTTYSDAKAFLHDTEDALATNEPANSLMLGVCMRLVREPERAETAPCLKTITDAQGLVLAAMMTPPHKLVVYGHQGDLATAARRLVADLVDEEWDVPGVLGPRAAAEHLAAAWAARTGVEVELKSRLRVYAVREVQTPAPERGRLRQATAADVALVTDWRCAFRRSIFGEADREEAREATEREIAQERVYLWDDRGPRSLAMTTRPTTHGISVTMVYTPPEWRGQGYATACVGELSRRLLAAGRDHVALFADLDNPAANRVYQRIGFQAVCDYDEYAFVGT
jgi:hypothetical protein